MGTGSTEGICWVSRESPHIWLGVRKPQLGNGMGPSWPLPSSHGMVLPPRLPAQPPLQAWRQPVCQEGVQVRGGSSSPAAAGRGWGPERGVLLWPPNALHSVAFQGQRKSPPQMLLADCRDTGKIRQTIGTSLVNNEHETDSEAVSQCPAPHPPHPPRF